MTASPPNPDVPASSLPSVNTEVWDRLWRYGPSEAKDDALLERERRSRRWAMIVERLESTFGSLKGLNTIELGCGRGDLSVLLALSGARVTLLDSSGKALSQARRRFERLNLSARYERADMLAIPKDLRDRFDVALSSGVVEHFEGDDRTRSLHAHLEVVRPGGMAVVSVPNAWCISYRVWKWYLEMRGWWPYGMELPYSRREIVRRAKEAGFARTEATRMRFKRSLPLERSTGFIKEHGPGRHGAASSGSGHIIPRDNVFGLILLLFGWRRV